MSHRTFFFSWSKTITLLISTHIYRNELFQKVSIISKRWSILPLWWKNAVSKVQRNWWTWKNAHDMILDFFSPRLSLFFFLTDGQGSAIFRAHGPKMLFITMLAIPTFWKLIFEKLLSAACRFFCWDLTAVWFTKIAQGLPILAFKVCR